MDSTGSNIERESLRVRRIEKCLEEKKLASKKFDPIWSKNDTIDFYKRCLCFRILQTGFIGP